MFLGKTRLFQPGVQIDRAIKFSADIGLAAAFSHDLGIGSGAEHKLQCIQHDGFTCAGFAGQHGKAGLPVQIQ